MAKALKEVAKPKKLIPDAYLFFFIAIVLNYVWRTLDGFMSKSFFTFIDLAEKVSPGSTAEGIVWRPLLGGNFWGYTSFGVISVVVWLLSLYSLYILFTMVKKKERFWWSLALLILGALFYLMTIFY